eukprot:CAMPEP_0117467080 /NCGR_PEP_ID=MMETSP0784-20121206/5471_1 /TAXON_ID=39447 /ORGANISM="" /LENGTH=946 /DNA_ID=CAMNT_0005261037 /DNA_START=34 /DNA_END=2871 /DNA_ORIENTATION=-
MFSLASPASMSQCILGRVLQTLFDIFLSIWIELLFMTFFALSFVLLQRKQFGSSLAKKSRIKYCTGDADEPQAASVEENCADGDTAAILATWRAERSFSPMSEDMGERLSSCGHALAIRSLLQAGFVGAAMGRALLAAEEGCSIPAELVMELLKSACKAGLAREAFDRMNRVLTLTPDAITALLDDCLKRLDLDLAVRISDVARETKIALTTRSYNALLKLYAQTGDARALPCFARMQEDGVRVGEGFCVGIISVCAHAKFVSFAEAIVEFTRVNRKSMTVYSALMKVYAHSGMYDKACSVYDEMFEAGLEPDCKMCLCLMRFACECGRTDLLRLFCERAPWLMARHYMFILKSCGRAVDVDSAIFILRQLEASWQKPDIAAYRLVLNVCFKARDVDRVHQVLRQMPFEFVDERFYSVMFQAYCLAGLGARTVLVEMSKVGLKPNTKDFNRFLSATASCTFMHQVQQIRQAWSIVDMMQKDDIAIDTYTIVKLLKCFRESEEAPREMRRVLRLVDHSKLDVARNEVLLCAVLDACIRCRSLKELHGVLNEFEANFPYAECQLEEQTCATLIRAYGMTHRANKCREVWIDVVGRHTAPCALTVGCMMDALVSCSVVEEAMAVFASWKAKGGQSNAVMYSILIKGLRASRCTDRAVKLFDEMHADGVKPSTSTYNAMIDALARTGSTSKVLQLLSRMRADDCKVDGVTFATVVKAYCVHGNLDAAVAAVYELAGHESSKPSSAYNTVLEHCIRAKRHDLCNELVHNMDRCNVTPTNFTIGSHIKHYSRTNQIGRAIEIVNTWPAKYNLVLNSAVKSCLVRACMRCGAIDQGTEVLRGLLEDKCFDSKMLKSLMVSCLMGDLLDEAVALADEACGLVPPMHSAINGKLKLAASGASNTALDPELVERLLSTLVQKGRLEQARYLAGRIRETGACVPETLLAPAQRVAGN